MRSKAPSIVALLRKVRARISRKNGWIKGSMAVGKGVCLLGAVNFASSGSPYQSSPLTNPLLLSLVDVLPGKYGKTLMGFNDRVETRKRDVLRVIDRAIRREKAKGRSR